MNKSYKLKSAARADKKLMPLHKRIAVGLPPKKPQIKKK